VEQNLALNLMLPKDNVLTISQLVNIGKQPVTPDAIRPPALL
jgi:hypothetical protein